MTPDDEKDKWTVVHEETGKTLHIPHPVHALRVWNASTRSYVRGVAAPPAIATLEHSRLVARTQLPHAAAHPLRHCCSGACPARRRYDAINAHLDGAPADDAECVQWYRKVVTFLKSRLGSAEIDAQLNKGKLSTKWTKIALSIQPPFDE